jgi:hypothetical protein
MTYGNISIIIEGSDWTKEPIVTIIVLCTDVIS